MNPQSLPSQGIDPTCEPTEVVSHLFLKLGFKNVVVCPQLVVSWVRTIVSPLVLDQARDAILPLIMLKWLILVVPLWVYGTFLMSSEATFFHKFVVTMAYYALWFDNLEPYILGLHCLVHRPVFVPVAKVLLHVYVWGFGPVLGMVPETYYSHHIGVHHPMNNGYDDISSTMTYCRDNVWHFLIYAIRFQFCHVALARQLLRIGNTKRLKSFIAGETFWVALALSVGCYRGMWTALLFVVLPVIITRLGMTAGNWGQHAFINPQNPFSNHNQSTVIINSIYNVVGYNDGYHIMHHCHPSAHYLDLPKLFVADMAAMGKADSIVFDSSKSEGLLTDWVTVCILLLRGKYDILAKCFVDIRALSQGSKPRGTEEVIKMLQGRVRRVYDESEGV
jgi:hypothetical protein